MLSNIKSIVIGVLSFVIIVLFLSYVMSTSLYNFELNYDDFYKNQQEFTDCLADDKYKNDVDSYVELIKAGDDVDTEYIEDLATSITCNSLHTISSEQQIQGYATEVDEHISSQTNLDMHFVTTVYTMPSQIAAIYSIPQPYLFFMLDESEQYIMASIYFPSEDGGEIYDLWTFEEASNLEVVEQRTREVQYIFNQAVK